MDTLAKIREDPKNLLCHNSISVIITGYMLAFSDSLESQKHEDLLYTVWHFGD